MKNRLVVLNYHQTTEQPDPMKLGSLGRSQFRAQLSILKRYFNVLSLPDAMSEMANNSLPSRAIVITFDDGYRDNYTVALEELQRAKLSATFFIATDFLDGGRMWNDTIVESVRRAATSGLDLSWLGLDAATPVATIEDKRSTATVIIGACKYLNHEERVKAVDRLAQQVGEPLPDELMMTSGQVQELHAAGMTIGGHTASHPILTSITPAEVLDEMRKGKHVLEELLGDSVEYFAYPNGKPNRDYTAEHVALVKEAGFLRGFSTEWGYVDRQSDHYQSPRVGFDDYVGFNFSLRLLRSYFEAAASSAD